MSAPAGYKATDVGVIPEDWDVEPLGTLIGPLDAGVSVRSVSDNVASSGHGQLVLKTSCISNGRFIATEAKPILPADLARAKTSVKGGSILISRMNTPDLVGEVGYVPEDRPNLYLPDRLWMASSATGRKSDMRWLAAHLSHGKAGQALRDTATGTSGSMKNISKTALRRVLVPTPDPEEQTAIAEALSDMDEAIAAQEAVIAKKRALKTATMQALLSGTRRLPGFSGEWEVKALGDVAQIDRDNLGSSTSPNYTFRYISLEDVDRGTLRQTTQQTFATAPSRARRRVAVGDVLFGTVRPNLQSHALISDDAEDLVCSTGFAVIRCDATKADPKFVFFNFFSGFVEKQIERLLAGSNYPAISNKDVAAIEIKAPNVEEQRSIADVIFDMDKDVSRQIAKLAKLRDLKTGMMQQLLTGKIRLV